MSKKIKVIIIIPSFNGQNYLQDLLPDLVSDEYQDFDLDVLVVDNNSSDDSVAYIRDNFSQVKVIVNKKNTGYVGANNIAYQYAKEHKADFIYLLNQDTEISKGFLQPLYDFAKNNKFGSLQSKLLLSPDKNKINSLGNVIHFLGFGYSSHCGEEDNEKQKITTINYSSGAAVFISMEALSRLENLFDETMFMYLEDLDLGWTLQLLGYQNYLIPDSVIYHKYEFDRSIKQVYWFERNRLWVMLKNYKLVTLLFLFPAGVLMEIAQLFYAWQHKYLKQKLKSYSWLFSLSQWKILRQKRKFIQQHRVTNDRFILKQFSGKILFQPLESQSLKIANEIFDLYFKIIRLFIFW
ncbi:glycosyltransferase family 2 protein [bacterium]|nr:glycosyltransferase family 2 protein [bacterium]MBT4649485.1 glycosyltransferase family 2 protein [bacterium]